MAIGKTSKKFPEVSQPQKPLETLENLGNLLEMLSMETSGDLWNFKKTFENVEL